MGIQLLSILLREQYKSLKRRSLVKSNKMDDFSVTKSNDLKYTV